MNKKFKIVIIIAISFFVSLFVVQNNKTDIVADQNECLIQGEGTRCFHTDVAERGGPDYTPELVTLAQGNSLGSVQIYMFNWSSSTINNVSIEHSLPSGVSFDPTFFEFNHNGNDVKASYNPADLFDGTGFVLENWEPYEYFVINFGVSLDGPFNYGFNDYQFVTTLYSNGVEVGSNDGIIRYDQVAVCANSVVEAPEVCDGNSQACTTSLGYSGTQDCNSQCSGFLACQTTEFCGDGIVNGTEQCDGSAACTSSCTTDTTPPVLTGNLLSLNGATFNHYDFASITLPTAVDQTQVYMTGTTTYTDPSNVSTNFPLFSFVNVPANSGGSNTWNWNALIDTYDGTVDGILNDQVWPLTYPAGTYTFEFYFEDAAGNRTDSDAVTAGNQDYSITVTVTP
jgi:hypothetical protein